MAVMTIPVTVEAIEEHAPDVRGLRLVPDRGRDLPVSRPAATSSCTSRARSAPVATPIAPARPGAPRPTGSWSVAWRTGGAARGRCTTPSPSATASRSSRHGTCSPRSPPPAAPAHRRRDRHHPFCSGRPSAQPRAASRSSCTTPSATRSPSRCSTSCPAVPPPGGPDRARGRGWLVAAGHTRGDLDANPWERTSRRAVRRR